MGTNVFGGTADSVSREAEPEKCLLGLPAGFSERSVSIYQTLRRHIRQVRSVNKSNQYQKVDIGRACSFGGVQGACFCSASGVKEG